VRAILVRRPRRRASPDASRPPGRRPATAPAAQPDPAGPEYGGDQYARSPHTRPDESEGDDGGPAYWVPGSLDPAGLEPAGHERPRLEPGSRKAGEVPAGKLITVGLSPDSGRIAIAGNPSDLIGGQPDLALREPGLLAEAGRLALAWATERRLSRSTACGITLALAVCAAAWFSAGTRTDIIRGTAALWTGYLVLKAGQRLAAGRSPAAAVDWLAALGSCLAECVVYAGLAAGAAAEHWSRAWPLAIAVLGLVGVRNLMSVCSVLPAFGEQHDGAIRRVGAAALTMAPGGRILVIGLAAPVWGPRVAMLALLAWAIVSICCGLAGRAASGVNDQRDPSAGRSSLLVRLRDDGALARGAGALVRGNLLPLPPALLGLSAIAALALLGLRGLPWPLMIAPAVVMLLAAPGSAHPHTGRFDWLVPALLFGAQILYLTAVGLGAGVPDPVIFVLGAALLMRYADLACPGRPVMLARGQRADSEAGERGTALGWEGRLLIAGLAAAMGLATFAYLALTVYFGFLICAKVVTSFVARQEELTRDRLGDGRRRKPSAAS